MAQWEIVRLEIEGLLVRDSTKATAKCTALYVFFTLYPLLSTGSTQEDRKSS